MQNTMVREATHSGSQHEGYRSIISNLTSLVDQVRSSVEMIDSAIARETHLGDQDATDIVELDDLTPRYMEASAALNTCQAYLGIAMHFLLDPEASKRAGEGSGR